MRLKYRRVLDSSRKVVANQRRWGFKKTVLLLVVGLVGVWSAWSLFSLFNIKTLKITFSNTVCDDQEKIKRDLSFEGKSIFFVNPGVVNNTIRNKYLCVAWVEIAKFYPNKVDVLVEGRQPIAVLIPDRVAASSIDLSLIESTPSTGASLLDFSRPDDAGERYLLGIDGLVFLKTEGDVNLPYVYYFGGLELKTRLDKTLVDGLNSVFKVVNGQIDIDFMKINPAGNLIIIEKNGRKTVLGLNGDVLRQLASLQLLWQKNKIESKRFESIDLRFSKPVVVYSK